MARLLSARLLSSSLPLLVSTNKDRLREQRREGGKLKCRGQMKGEKLVESVKTKLTRERNTRLSKS